jgi:hypothetical protein
MTDAKPRSVTSTEESTSDQHNIAERLAALEAALAEGERRKAVDYERVNTTKSPPEAPRWVSEGLKLQLRARQARVKAMEEADEAARLQAIKHAPKQAKRDAELASRDERRSKEREEFAAAELAWVKERVKLANAPL